MTTEEALIFAAQLKLPQSMSLEEKKQSAFLLIKRLGLEHVKDQYIGYTGAAARNSGIARGLSGGERKRVSVCFEMVSNPRILFLDEPTSGLDSFAAKTVVENLRDLTFYGRTIIATVHQPSAEIFRMFDYLLLLASGQTVYFGPAHKAISYFSSIGIHPPAKVNPADFLLKVIHIPPPEENKFIEEVQVDDVEQSSGLRAATHEQVDMLINEYKKSDYCQVVSEKLNLNSDEEEELRITKEERKSLKKNQIGINVPNGYLASYYLQFKLLLLRSYQNSFRDPSLLKARILRTFAIAVLAGLIWLRLPYTQAGASNRASSLFFILISATFASLNGPIFVFPSERGVFFREKSSKMYSSGIYYLSKLLTELPINIVLPLIGTTIEYWMIGYNNSPIPWLLVVVITILLNVVGNAVGMALSCAILNTGVVIKIQPLILIPLMLFGGYFINNSSVPDYFVWLSAISFLKYAFRASANSIFSLGDVLNFDCPNGECTYPNGYAVLNSLDFVGHPIWFDIVILIIFTIGTHLIAFGFLYFHAKRRS